MGFSFSLKNANAVGHLIEGNVITFLDESAKSEEMLRPNLEFVDRLVTRTHDDFYTSEILWDRLSPDIQRLREEWSSVRKIFERLTDKELVLNYFLYQRNRELLSFFNRLSSILSRCKIKTLLLPGFEDTKLNRAMYDRHFLHELVRIHPGDSALILQVKERMSKRDTSILNTFSKFETAYSNIDLWPGVLLWNDNDSLFLKAESENQLREIYEILRFEKNSFSYLRNNYARQQESKRHAYFFGSIY